MRKLRNPGRSIVFKSLSGVVVLLVVFSVTVSLLGYHGFTEAMLKEYSESAFQAAKMVDFVIEMDFLADNYKDFDKEFFESAQEDVSWLCNLTGMRFIYIIKPDLNDYGHITFLVSTVNFNSDFEPYEYGHVEETTNDEYRKKYRNLFEEKSQKEFVVRDTGYIKSDPHITAMIPLKDINGKTIAVICVQRQMDNLFIERDKYIRTVIVVLFVLAFAVMVIEGIYLHKVFLMPVKKITHEASRFAKENLTSGQKLTEIIRNKDEIGLLADSIDSMETQICSYVDDITQIAAERERIRTELELAAKIQSDMLPDKNSALPDRSDFDIAASMKPARGIGGDFYDFFMTDDDHLCIVIADVSGKGVPAALFMMLAKTILTDNVKEGKSPAEILASTNNALCSNNRENMFVTVWLGILELSTGKLTAANAGHEYPAMMMPDGKFRIIKDKHGIVLGGMPGMKYTEYELKMEKGSKLFVYTDGITEASDKDNAMFGTENMLSALNTEPDTAPAQILENVTKAASDFVMDAEQFDDMTMLCLEYKGKINSESEI